MKIDVRTFQAGYYLLQCTTMDGENFHDPLYQTLNN